MAAYLYQFPETNVIGPDEGLIAALRSAPPRQPYEQMSVSEVRKLVNGRILSSLRRNEAVATVENASVRGVPVRIYVPQGTEPFPIVTFFHGGGWVAGNLDTHDDFCRSLARRAEAKVVSVDYRLAPEHRFPAALEDSYAVFEWCAGESERIAVVGDSAGGNLAAAIALKSRDCGGPKIALQALIYPITNFDFDTESYDRNASGYGLIRETMIYYWRSYVAEPRDRDNPYAAPLRAKSFERVAPALIITAEYDPLRDDGLEYAKLLADAGVRVRCTNYLDMNHGFLVMGGQFASATRALEELTGELKAALSVSATPNTQTSNTHVGSHDAD